MRILNLYAGIGGNRNFWGSEHEITAVEHEQYIADVYAQLYPGDTVVVADAHQYLLDHFQDFDFIWSSPPCPTHSKLVTAKRGWGIYEYPDMKLYQEIIFLQHNFKGKWLVENVEPYYRALLLPRMTIGRHFLWSNFHISKAADTKAHVGNLSDQSVLDLQMAHGIELPLGTLNARKLLRNAVEPRIGEHILKAALKTVSQDAML